MVTAARLLCVLVAVLALAPAALAQPAAPTGLHGFLLSTDEAEKPTHTFSRTPAFSWNPVPGAERYEFELATSKSFAENAVVWEDTELKSSLTTVPLTLPWISGAKYSWFARVRAVVLGEEGPWSAPWGFNMRASGAPRSLSSGTNPNPGMVRWTPVDGATAYEVSFLFDLGQAKGKLIKTATTAADLREYYAFHNTFPSVISWRARAVREVEGKTKNSLPVVSYGPWSARNRTVEPALSTSALALQGTISRSRLTDVQGTTAFPGAHELIPGFWWSGSRSLPPDLFGTCPLEVLALLGPDGPAACPLFRVYVYTDADCVNRVHVGDLVGSPAYVPRLTGPLDLPGDMENLGKAPGLYLEDGDEGKVYDAGGEPVLPTGVTEEDASQEPVADEGSGEEGSEGSTDSDSADESGSTDSETPAADEVSDRSNGLWDNDHPTSRYYWTVVPTVPHILPDEKVVYRDVAFGEDMCTAAQVGTFGKTSAAVTSSASGVPYASGLSSTGQLVGATTAKPTFFGKPVIAWEPAPGAQKYELQWSKTGYPWRTAGKLVTPATGALLDLPVGNWFYRVRGLDETLPGASGLTWSEVAELQIMPRTFQVVSKKAGFPKKAKVRKKRR